jgi:hypothetical protein
MSAGMSSTEAALHRLQASRASIDAELRKLRGLPDDDDDPAAGRSGASSTASPPAWSAAAAPWLATVTRALRLWWRRHPARPVLDIASDAGTLALTPLVRTHPIASLSLAMAAGAAMVFWRPWRSRLSAAVWAGLGAQLTAGLVRTVLNPGTLGALLGSLPPQRAAPPPPAPPSTSPPPEPTP